MIPIPLGTVAFNGKEAFTICRKFGSDYTGKFVVKAQVKTPARSKGYFLENNFKGGIHVVGSMQEVKDVADKMCGKKMVIPGRLDRGLRCHSVLVMEYIKAKN
jgi:succinyl-CoA synthetase beta subunit